ncbi:MAG TPA: BlaI/MecI/CopY family transcriptional regulator [Thermoanaerobaculia bacterium]|jgi:BlaI family penicillinase repressor|nr:BlaI/MecI/CopY family transcriptional regulator [Thermoanaerobaculia bacterium]
MPGARAAAVRLTRFELEVMDHLWRLGRASVRELLEALPARRRPAYTTVQTIVRRLEEKGAARLVRKIGNAHIYEPAVTREAAYRRLVKEFLDIFGGSARPLMAHLAESGELTLEDVHALERALAASPGEPRQDE